MNALIKQTNLDNVNTLGSLAIAAFSMAVMVGILFSALGVA